MLVMTPPWGGRCVVDLSLPVDTTRVVETTPPAGMSDHLSTRVVEETSTQVTSLGARVVEVTPQAPSPGTRIVEAPTSVATDPRLRARVVEPSQTKELSTRVVEWMAQEE